MPAISSKEYWEKRSELSLIQNEKSALQYETLLKKSYEDTIREIKKEVSAFYQRHSDETGVTLTSARRRLKPDEMLDFNQQAQKYLDEVQRLGDKAFTEEYRDYLKKLSGKAYISKMDELVTNIRHNIETLSTGYNIGLGNTLKDAYEDGYFRSMFDAQKQMGIGVSFTTPGGKQLEAAVKEKWLGQNYSDRIWADKQKLVNSIEQMLSQEFVRGRGPNEIASDFSKRLNVSYSNARRLIRTEINYISNKGSIQAYKDTGILDRYRYLATLDSRTSDICREMDGKVFELKEAKVGVNLPPLHPYCRSTTIPHFDDDEIGDLIDDRIARDEDGDGKSIRLGENLNFFDWVDKYGSERFKQRVSTQRAKFNGMNTTSSITDALVADELLNAFDPDNYEPVTKDEVIETMKSFYGGESIRHYDMPKPYQDYVATSNSFGMNSALYTGKYEAIKSGKREADDWEMDFINEIDAFKDYVNKAPNLPKNSKLVRFINERGLQGIVKLVVGDDSIAQKITSTVNEAVFGSEEKESARREFTSQVAGAVFESNSFISTSYNIKQNVFTDRPYQLEIYADEGANALMTYNHQESEIVLNVGTKLEFIDIDIKEERAIVKMRAHSNKKF